MIKKSATSKKNKVSDDSIINLQESIISRVNPDKTVSIVNIELDDTCYSLDGIAAEIWTLINGKNSVSKIKSNIMKKHKPPTILFEKDFNKFLSKLTNENLVVFS